MRGFRGLTTVLVAALIVAGVGMIHGHDGQHAREDKPSSPEEISVRGEILDMACYVAHEAKGPDHAACAKRCVMGGQPMGLLAEDGTVYLLYANHDDATAYEAAKEFAGQKVEISGIAAVQSGVKGLEVSRVQRI